MDQSSPRLLRPNAADRGAEAGPRGHVPDLELGLAPGVRSGDQGRGGSGAREGRAWGGETQDGPREPRKGKGSRLRGRERRGHPRARPSPEGAPAECPCPHARGSARVAAQNSVIATLSLCGCNGPISRERSANLVPSPPTPHSRQTLARAVFSLCPAPEKDIASASRRRNFIPQQPAIPGLGWGLRPLKRRTGGGCVGVRRSVNPQKS